MKVTLNEGNTYQNHLIALLTRELGEKAVGKNERAIIRSLFKNLATTSPDGVKGAFIAIYKAFGHHGEKSAAIQVRRIEDAIARAKRQYQLV